ARLILWRPGNRMRPWVVHLGDSFVNLQPAAWFSHAPNIAETARPDSVVPMRLNLLAGKPLFSNSVCVTLAVCNFFQNGPEWPTVSADFPRSARNLPRKVMQGSPRCG